MKEFCKNFITCHCKDIDVDFNVINKISKQFSFCTWLYPKWSRWRKLELIQLTIQYAICVDNLL